MRSHAEVCDISRARSIFVEDIWASVALVAQGISNDP